MKTSDNKNYIGSVKVGPKGQIVIPKDVRDMFGIEPGDTLIILADSKKGIALERFSIFSGIADKILSGHGKELYPDRDEKERMDFAQAIKEMEENDECD